MRIFFILLSLWIAASGCGKKDNVKTVPNTGGFVTNPASDIGEPLYRNRTTGAVHMMQSSDGHYYSYDGDVSDWPIFRSSDGVSWEKLENRGYPDGTWGKKNFWVPEVIEYNGKFHMYYCARENAATQSSRIGLAISDSPTGPFIDTGIPLFNGTTMHNWHVIDPNPFIDPSTGKKFLYFVKDGALYSYWNEDLKRQIGESRIYGVELAADMKSVVGEPVLLFGPSQEWEYKSFLLDGRKLWNEAPEMIKENGKYFLMYSGNFFQTEDYAIGYASSQNPLGPFVKYEKNPIISSVGNFRKAGHNSLIRSKDGSEIFTSYTTMGDGRYMSRMGVRTDGTLYANGPIKGYQVMPNGTTDYVNVAKEAEVSVSSTKQPYRKQALTDGEIGLYERYERYEWSSDEGKNAWIKFFWSKPQKVKFILLYGSAVQNRKIKSGSIVLNEDPKETISNINFPSDPGEPALVQFSVEKDIHSLKFVINDNNSNEIAGMSEIVILGKKH